MLPTLTNVYLCTAPLPKEPSQTSRVEILTALDSPPLTQAEAPRLTDHLTVLEPPLPATALPAFRADTVLRHRAATRALRAIRQPAGPAVSFNRFDELFELLTHNYATMSSCAASVPAHFSV